MKRFEEDPRLQILGVCVLIVFCWFISSFSMDEVIAAGETIATAPSAAFYNVSGKGGKIRATQKKTIHFRGSSVTVNAATGTVTIDGQDGCSPQLGVDTWCNGRLIPAYYDGRTLPTLFGNISGGNSNFDYNEYGQLPTPAPKQFKARLYLNGVRTTPTRVTWTATGLASGTATTTTFTPNILDHYSSSHSTKISVQFTYSTVAGWGGKRYYNAEIIPAINRKGGVGPKGDPGSDATVTEAAVISAFATTQTSNNFELRATNDVDQKFSIYNSANNNTMYFDGFGNQYWITSTGEVAVKVLASGGFYIFKGGIKRFEVEDDGAFSQFKPDGTRGFRCISSGVCYGPEGLPPSNGLCTSKNTDGTVSYITCGAGGGGSPGGLEGQTQVKRGSGFGAVPFAKFTSLSVNEGMLKIPAGYKSLRVVNSTNGIIMSLYSSKRVVIGGA